MKTKKHGIRRRIGSIFKARTGEKQGTDLVRLTPDKPVVGRVLMSYATKVYHDLLQGKGLDRTHVSAWQNFHISRTFLDLGFEVDVFHFEDSDFEPDRSYDIVIDIISNLGWIADSQNHEPTTILFPMFAHWTEHNSRSLARHRDLAHRRGVSIPPKRLIMPSDSVERADHILCKGGTFGRRSYSYSETAVTPITQIRPHAINEFIQRDIGRCRRTFVWIGGSSAVHKGLDLVLEAFSDLPDLNLIIIGNVPSERKFAEVYKEELFNSPNIATVGWTDTLSHEFRDIVSNAIAIVAPSASELSCGSVIAGMMTGLIPIATEGTDIDVSGIGFAIGDDTVDGVCQAILALTNESSSSLAELSRAAWEASQEVYGKQKFLDTFRAAVCDSMALDPAPEWKLPNGNFRIPTINLV